MPDPRIFVFSISRQVPSQEIPLDWLRQRHEREPAPERAIEIVPGVRAQLMGIGGIILPNNDYCEGARIAVWVDGALPDGALTDTQWGVRYSDLRGVLEYAPYDDEEDARDHTRGISPPLIATVVSRRRWWTRWAEAPEPKDGDDA